MQWICAYTIGKKQQVFDLVLAPSDFLVRQIQIRYPGMPVKRMYNVCNSLSSIQTEKQRSKDKSGKLKLVYFGRLDPIKGLPNFLNALKNFPMDYSFTIIGEGDELPVIQACIEQYQIRDKIILRPQLNQANLFAELPQYDVFVLPSFIYENAPLSIIEAASLGLSLFVSCHGGILEMGKLCNASHFLNPFDLDDIVSNLHILYEDFLAGRLPKADFERLQTLFSRETYIHHLHSFLRHDE